MGRFTADVLQGIWAGIPMSWDERFMLDEKSYRTKIERMCREGVHGIYTTGSTGEFYVLDFDEFRCMVDIQVEICALHGVPLQIGCGAENTGKTIRLLEYTVSQPYIGAAQVHLPYWMELTDHEILRFFSDLYAACPDLPLVHYNIPRAKRFLFGPDYLRILDNAPSLIGVTFTFAGSYFDKLQEAIMLTPGLSYFVTETLLATGMMIGARGSYSSLVYTSPRFILELYDNAAHNRWEEALAMQKIAHAFVSGVVSFVQNRGEGCMDPVIEKGMGIASGCLVGSQRTRAPYIGWSNETVSGLRSWMKHHFPQFVYIEG